MWGRRKTRWRSAEELFRTYVLDIDDFWTGKMRRQAVKLQRQLESLERQHGWEPQDVVDRVIEAARARHPGPPPAVYVTGLGSSGSHWLAGMLADLDGFVDVGEVYFSTALREALDRLGSREEQLFVADAIQLLHGLPKRADVAALATVNSAAGAYEAELYRGWDPRAVVVYLHRDPRDQVLSATFRKDEYRRFQDPEADDLEYVLRMCRRNRSDRDRYVAAGVRADHEVAYEALRAGPSPILRGIASSAGRATSAEVVDRAVERHDAAAIRAGDAESVGNLDLGGRSRGWREDANRELREVLHVELAETVVALGYPLEECLRGGDELASPVRWDDPAAASPVLCAAGGSAVTDELVGDLLARGPVVLDLSRTGVTDAVIERLASSTSIRVVGLRSTAVTENGRHRLRTARPELIIHD